MCGFCHLCPLVCLIPRGHNVSVVVCTRPQGNSNNGVMGEADTLGAMLARQNISGHAVCRSSKRLWTTRVAVARCAAMTNVWML